MRLWAFEVLWQLGLRKDEVELRKGFWCDLHHRYNFFDLFGKVVK